MVAIKGITVAVGEWYARTLEICLVRNMRHLTECLVVTTPTDDAVKAVVEKVPGARVFETDAFYRHGAKFNKGLSLELGFDVLGRDGWIAVLDGDILLPDSLPLDRMQPGSLYGAKRRILEDPSKWHADLDWNTCPPTMDGGPIGFTQFFAGDSLPVRNARPWYDVSFAHAGGCDAYFLEIWKRARAPLVVLPMEVLHLGKPDANWFGTDQASRDLMAKYVYQNGWRRAMKNFDRAAVVRAGELPPRLEVPGYPPSNYDLPFERKARMSRRK